MSHYSVGVILPKDQFDILGSTQDELRGDINYFIEMWMEPFEENPELHSDYVVEHNVTKPFIDMYIKNTQVTYLDNDGREYQPYLDFEKITEQVTQEEYEKLPEDRRIPTDETFAKVVRFGDPESNHTQYRKLRDNFRRVVVQTYKEKSFYNFIVEDMIGDIDSVPIISFDTEEYNTQYFIRSDLNNECLYCSWDKTPTVDDFHDLEIVSVYNDQGYWDYWNISETFYIPLKDKGKAVVTKIKNIADCYENGSTFSTYALIVNGEWYQPEKMGWFGESYATKNQEKEYLEFFKESLAKADPDDLFVILDCHI